MKLRNGWIAATLFAATLAGGIIIGTSVVKADGIPNTDALYYTGYLTDSDVPIDGDRDMTVKIWDDASAGSELCSTDAPDTELKAGRFRVALATACIDAVRDTPDVWVELVVGTISMGRTKVGAVPYAVVADRAQLALGASGMLASTLDQMRVDVDNAQSNAAIAQSSVSSLESRVNALESTVSSHASELNSLENAMLPYFMKGGNNGTVSCSVFCAGSQWGDTGTCVGAQNTGNNAYVRCADTASNSLRCWCSKP